MEFVSKAKRSKKAQAELNKKQREFWTMNPVTRIKPSKKIYNRARFKAED